MHKTLRNGVRALVAAVLLASTADARPEPTGTLEAIRPCGFMDCPGGRCTLEFVDDSSYQGGAYYLIEIAAEHSETAQGYHSPYPETAEIFVSVAPGVPFVYTFDDPHPPGTIHCARIARTEPSWSGFSSRRTCWLNGTPRAPLQPAISGATNGASLLVDVAGPTLAACKYSLELARDQQFTDVVHERTSSRYSRIDGVGLAFDWGQRVYWRVCSENPSARSCTTPREAWNDSGPLQGLLCPLSVVGSGTGVGGTSYSHLHVCRDYVYPTTSPNGAYYLRDKAWQNQYARVSGGHYHSGGEMNGDGFIATRRIDTQARISELLSYDSSFDDGDEVARDAVTVHAHAGGFFQEIESALGWWPKLIDGNCHYGAGVLNFVGSTTYPDGSSCHDNADFSNAYPGSVQFCLPGAEGLRTAGSLDALAHEYGHVMTYCTSQLENDGAYASMLDEALSDILQAEINRRLGSSYAWRYGDDMGGAVAIRDMAEPWNLGQPAVWMGPRWGPWNGCDGSCVHENSTVVGKMYQLLAEGGINPETGLSVPGIGYDRAFRSIWYANATRLPRTIDDLSQVRMIHAVSTADLYGQGGQEVTAVEAAWDAVGVPPREGVVIPPSRPLAPGGGCSCGADCDGNCTIELGELVVAINIGLEKIPLHECPVADVDGNGTVAINDLTSAVHQSLYTCDGSGESGSASSVTYSPATMAPSVNMIGGTTSPGYLGTMDFSFSGGQGVVTSLQMDVLFDDSRLSVDSCDSFSILDTHDFAWEIVAPGRLRVIAVSFTLEPLPEGGSLAACDFYALENAACGNVPLTIANAVAAVSDGATFALSSAGATINLVNCPSTSTPTRTATRTATRTPTRTRTSTRTATRTPTRTATPGDPPPMVWAEFPTPPKIIKGGEATLTISIWFSTNASSAVLDFLLEHPDSGPFGPNLTCEMDENLVSGQWSASEAWLIGDEWLSLHRLHVTPNGAVPHPTFGFSGPIVHCRFPIPNTDDALGEYNFNWYGAPTVRDPWGNLIAESSYANNPVSYHVSACQITAPAESRAGTWLAWPVVLLFLLARRGSSAPRPRRFSKVQTHRNQRRIAS